MKKQRLLSLLLAASLTASSLPMMATSIAAEDETSTGIQVGQNLMNVTYGTADNVVAPAEGETNNNYLHVGNRNQNRDSGFTYTIGKPLSTDGGNTYYVTYYIRHSVPFDMDSTVYDVSKGHLLRMRASVDGTGTNKDTHITTTEGWQLVKRKIAIDSTMLDKTFSISVYASTDSRFRDAYDIDNFKVVVLNADGTEVENHPANCFYDFEGSTGTPDSKFTSKNNATIEVVSAENYAVVSEDETTGEVVYSYKPASEVKLEAGAYEFAGDIRYGTFWGDVLSDLDGVPGTGDTNTWKNGSGYVGDLTFGTGDDAVTVTYNVAKDQKIDNDQMIFSNNINVATEIYIDETPNVADDDYTKFSTEFNMATVDWSALDGLSVSLANGGVLKEIRIVTERTKAPLASYADDEDGHDDDELAVQKTTPIAPIHLKNLSFALTQSFTSEVAVEKENLLDEATMTVNGATEAVEALGHLYIPQRDALKATQNNYATLTIPASLVSGKQYFVSFDACDYAGNSKLATIIRPIVNFDVEGQKVGETIPGTDYTVGMNGRYIVPTKDDVEGYIDNAWGTTNEAQGFKKYPQYYLTREMLPFEGTFIPTKNVNGSFQIIFNRGGHDDNYNNPIAIDNLKVWYMDGSSEVVVYETGFGTAPAESDISTYTKKHNNKNQVSVDVTHTVIAYQGMTIDCLVEASIVDTEQAHTVVTPTEGVAANVAYDLADVDTGVNGTYTFATSLAAVTTDGTAKAVITLSNGTVVESDTVNVVAGSEYTELVRSVYLTEGTTIESIEIVTTVTGGIKFTAPSLTFVPDAEGKGMPNIGIIMMMLLKKQGGASARPVKTEFIENGDFEQAVTIVDGIAAKSQTAANAGWYAKMADDQETVVSYETEGDNHFVRVSNLNTNQRGVWYNTGVTLEPGTYTLTADMRVSEGSDHPNYTAKEWRDAAKNTMQVRINLQNPASINSTYYQAFNPVDKDTFMNDSGNAVGTLITVNREWTKYTDTVVVEQPTLVILKIGGGTGADKDSHGFDIDNLSIVGYVTPVVEGGEDETESEFVSLIPNGNFATAPEVVKEGYDATKPAWYANAKMDYKYDNKGKAIETEPQFYHDHNVTWNEEGYVTLTGKAFNLAKMYYNPGVTLEAGSYVLSYDAKCANKGETTSIRLYTAPVATDKAYQAATAVTLTDAWATFTYEFTVTEAGGMRISIYGGPGASYLHDICLDNLVLTKK